MNVCNVFIIIHPQANPYEHELKCFYSTVGKNPLLILAPVKVEEIHNKPDIVLFHDVISDNEIGMVKKLSTPLVRFSYRTEAYLILRDLLLGVMLVCLIAILSFS